MVSGAALVVQRLAGGIVSNGHSAMVFAASDRGASYSKNENGVDVIHLQSHQNPYRVDQNFVIWSRAEIEKALHHFQPDVLHLHDPLNIGLAGLLSAQRKKIPTLVTIHQLPWFVSSYMGGSQLTKELIENSLWRYSNWFLGKCDRSITPSQMIAEIIEAHTDHSPTVISNGVDLDLFSPHGISKYETLELCEKYGIRPDHPIILYVGRLDPDKKVELVVQSAAKVMHQIPSQLLIVGDGIQRDQLIQLSKSLGIHENCCFPGFIPKSGDLPDLYRLASVFVTASEIEIQSSVVLEGAASGLPVVAVNASSMPELVLEGENGYLVQPGDVDGITERLIYLLQDREKIKRMGLAGRKLAEQHSTERFVGTHERLYRTVTHNSRVNWTRYESIHLSS
jgi:glycosyltransferase involved in cell wall biosynthesis